MIAYIQQVRVRLARSAVFAAVIGFLGGGWSGSEAIELVSGVAAGGGGASVAGTLRAEGTIGEAGAGSAAGGGATTLRVDAGFWAAGGGSNDCLAASENECGTIRVTWCAIPGATSYRLSRDGAAVYEGAERTFIDAATGEHTYVVEAFVGGAWSPPSAPRTGTGLALPNAAWSGGPVLAGEVPFAIQFADESEGAPSAWRWTFGDGDSSAAQNPAHVYLRAGTFDVTLAIDTDCGPSSLTRTAFVTVTDTTAPATVEGVTVRRVAQNTLRVDWSPSGAPDLDRYRLYRYRAARPESAQVVGEPADTSFVDNVPGPGRYCYRVGTLDLSGNESALTTPRCALTLAVVAVRDVEVTRRGGAPTARTASASNALAAVASREDFAAPGVARVSWALDSPNDGAWFDVHRDAGAGSPLVKINDSPIASDALLEVVDRSLPSDSPDRFRYWIVASDDDGEIERFGPFDLPISEPSPSPSLAITAGTVVRGDAGWMFDLALPIATDATLTVFDAQGRRLAEPHRGTLQAGHHRLSWNAHGDDGKRAASGVYFARLTTPLGDRTLRAVIVR
ncbi:MAG: PKD domain-containing protein [bacterium]